MIRLTAKESGENLLQLLLKENVLVENPCGGKGICGKCKVKVLSGWTSPETAQEKAFLTEAEQKDQIRLSCLTEVRGPVQIELIQKERNHRVLTKGYLPEFEKEYREEGLGVIVDIGTTTVVASLVDLTNGEELSDASGINAQKNFGLDVLTRITYEYEHPETGWKELQKAIVDSLNEMIREICQKAGRETGEILEIHVAANCTMMHMLLGVDARPIGKAPYQPIFLESKKLLAEEIGIYCGKETILYCLPHVSAYIGADIVAGAYVCELQKEQGNVLFVDIGTNGEIVLASKGHLYTCSCAAGPALEGMNISSGMRAAAGAVEEVLITEEGIYLQTIGDAGAEGLCGSGILSVVKEVVRTGILKKSGVFVKPERLEDEDYRKKYLRINGKNRELILQSEPELLVTQNDVRQVQLAKGAILSGFRALLKKADLKMEELDKVMIAGQFGAHLPADSLIGIGLLPECVREKLVYVGNSSKTGAYMTLMSETVRSQMEQLAEKMEYMELAESEDYEQIFIESMTFETW